MELRRRSALLQQAREVLAAGPVSTVELATRVLGLSGNEGAAARVVWSLLAEDPDLVVDGRGFWSLRSPVAPPEVLLREEPFVVVDVETTGGSPKTGHRVTEIAAVWVEGGRVRDVYSTLVNPDRPIPSMITSLTGITNGMVAGAPRFHEVVPQVERMLRGRVFVAHNAPFDWRFLEAEVQRATGRVPEGRQLCTVRLARKLLPQLSSRSLDSLADYFGLTNSARHRAEGDAVATAHVLLRFLEMLEEREVTCWSGVEALFHKRATRRKRSATPRSMDSA